MVSGDSRDVQSGAYAPPKRLPTRSPPINRDLTIPLAASHTLTRVAEANPPRRGRPASPHSRDDDEDHPCGQLSPCYLQHTPSCPTFLHSGGQEAPNSLSGAPEQVVEAAPLLSLCRSSAPGTHRLRCQLEGIPHDVWFDRTGMYPFVSLKRLHEVRTWLRVQAVDRVANPQSTGAGPSIAAARPESFAKRTDRHLSPHCSLALPFGSKSIRSGRHGSRSARPTTARSARCAARARARVLYSLCNKGVVYALPRD